MIKYTEKKSKFGLEGAMQLVCNPSSSYEIKWNSPTLIKGESWNFNWGIKKDLIADLHNVTQI